MCNDLRIGTVAQGRDGRERLVVRSALLSFGAAHPKMTFVKPQTARLSRVGLARS